MPTGEPEAFQDIDDRVWTQAINQFKKRTGRWPDGNEGFEIAQTIWERTHGKSSS